MGLSLLISGLILGSVPTEPLEILGEDYKVRDISAIAMSPDGKFQLACSGVGRSLDAFRFSGSAADRVRLPLIGIVSVPEFITSNGQIVCEYTQQLGPASAKRAYVYSPDGITTLPTAEPNRDPNSNFEVRGISADGALLGNIEARHKASDGPSSMGAAAIFRGGRFSIVHQTDFPTNLFAVVETTIGVAGEVPRPIGRLRWSNALPVLFLGNGRVQPLAMPRTYGFGSVFAATPDGSVIVGTLGRDGSNGVSAALWRNGECLPPANFKSGLPNGALTAVTKDGSLAVGTTRDSRGSLAVAWDKDLGYMPLADYARAKKVEMPEGWALLDAVGISPGGECVFGTAWNKKIRRPYRLWFKR